VRLRLRTVALGILGCSLVALSVQQLLPRIGEEFIPPKGAERGLCMVMPSQLDSCSHVTVADVEYAVAYRDNPKSRKPVVTYIFTKDPKFVSPAGKRVGDPIAVEYAKVSRWPGFQVYAGDPIGGWRAVVGFEGKVIVDSGDLVPLETLRNQKRTLRLRITGFASR
jgi:hypothetical protein